MEKFSMSSATDLTKAWLESLPTDVDEPTPTARAPHRSTGSRTLDARDKDALVLSSSASVHPLRRSQSRDGDTSGHVKRHLVKVSTSAQSISGVVAAGGRGGGRIEILKNTDDEFSDVDQAFDKLLGDFSDPRETAEVEKKTKAETGYAASQQDVEDSGGDRQISNYLWIRPTVIKTRTGQRKLPVVDGRNQANTKQERTEVDELEEEVREEREEASSRRSDRNTKNQRRNSVSPSSRGPVKAFYDYKPQHFSAQTLITASESDDIKNSAFIRKPSFRNNSVSSSADRTYQSSRDFATQTFGQMMTTSTTSCEAQTEISAVTNNPNDIMLKNSLTNSRESVEEYLSRHSLGGVNDASECRTNSSKSLQRSVETSKKPNNRELNKSFDDSVEIWSKKGVRSAENTAVGTSDRFDGHTSKLGSPAAADTVSVKSRSLSGASNSRRLMSLMLDEVKALKSFVQTHLDERQTTTNRTPTKQRLEEKDPDSDSAVELMGIVDKKETNKERESSKHRSHRSGRRHRRHRRTEDEENKEGYNRRSRRQSPRTRERTWDDVWRGPSVEDSRDRYFSMADGRRDIESVGASSVYNIYPHGDNRPIHPPAYHPFIPANGVNPTFCQSPFQLYQNRNVTPLHGSCQPPAMLPTYQADLANRFGGYAPMNTHPQMYNTMPADHTYPLRVPFPNSVAMIPAVEPTTYHAPIVHPALTFIPAGVTPIGPPIQLTLQGAWSPQGQFISKVNEARNPNNGGIVVNARDNVRVKRNESSARNSFRSGHQPKMLMKNSLNEALREAQGIRHLTERLGKDTRLTSY